jgi:uncharacterized membrane protein
MATSISTGAPASARLTKALALGAIFLIAAAFVLKYVFHYYLNYNPQGFYEYWPIRGWLLLHITSGMVALLTGPLQFSTWMRQRYLNLHRVMGRVYLIAVATGSAAAIGLSLSAVSGWAFDFSLFCMATVWATCGGMAYYAVRQRQIQVHKEWMVRTYILTFGFVTFRLLNDMGPTSHLKPGTERSDVFVWACWVMPLIAAEVIMQLMRMRRPARTA